MAKNKKQHFVPRQYLKRFANGENILFFSSEKNNISSVPYKDQCQKKYLYSKDLKYENSLSNLEDKIEKIFNIIFSSKKLPSKNSTDYLFLLIYVSYQYSRTLSASKQLDNLFDKMFKTIISDHIKFDLIKNLDINDLDKVKISMDNSAIFNLQIMSKSIPLLLDLESKLLINNTNIEFITSDNPVVHYNKYFLKDIDNYSGLASKGLLILFPLSPKYYIVFYDKNIYKIGGKKRHTPVIINCKNDIDQLNILQFISYHKSIYTYSMTEIYLKNLDSIARRYKDSGISKFSKSNLMEYENGKFSRQLSFIKPKILFELDVLFIKNSKKIKEDYIKQGLYRNPSFFKFYETEINRLESEEQEDDSEEVKMIRWNTFLTKMIYIVLMESK